MYDGCEKRYVLVTEKGADWKVIRSQLQASVCTAFVRIRGDGKASVG